MFTIKAKKDKQVVKNQDKRVLQELLDVKSINECYISKASSKITYCFIKIKPINVNIMPDKMIYSLVENFSILVDMVKDFDIFVTDKVQTLDDNKSYLENLLKTQENEVVRELLEKDIEMLKEFEEGESEGIAREFFIILQFRNADYEIFKGQLRDILKMFREQKFEVELATEKDIKSMLQVYLERNFSNQLVKDYNL